MTAPDDEAACVLQSPRTWDSDEVRRCRGTVRGAQEEHATPSLALLKYLLDAHPRSSRVHTRIKVTCKFAAYSFQRNEVA